MCGRLPPSASIFAVNPELKIDEPAVGPGPAGSLRPQESASYLRIDSQLSRRSTAERACFS
jgi:hypothetical protein